MKKFYCEDDIALPTRFEDVLHQSEGKPFAFDHGDLRTLHFDARFIQSAMRISAPDQLLLSYTRAMMAFLLFNSEPQHILMIGLGGGSLAKYCYRTLPATRITVLELDPGVIALRGKFAVPDDDERFQIVQVDAVNFLAMTEEKVDIILHDGYNADGLAPTLATEDFYRQCHRVLGRDGVLVSNLWGDATDLVPMMTQLYAVFGWRMWWCSASGSFNRIVFSIKNHDEPMFRSELEKRAIQVDLHHGLLFCELVDKMKTACGKSRDDFELIAGNDMLGLFMETCSASLDE